MQRNAVLLIGAFLMVNFFGCSRDAGLEKYETKDPEIGVSMLFPAGWKPSEDAGSAEKYHRVMFIEKKSEAERKRLSAISVLAIKASDTAVGIKDPESAVSDKISKASKLKDFQLLSKKEISIYGTKAAEAVYSYMTLDQPLPTAGSFVKVEEKLIIFEKGGKFYYIKLVCQENLYAGLEKTFERVLKSIRFLSAK